MIEIDTDNATWTPPTSFVILFLGAVQYFVDPEEARRIREFIDKHQDSTTPNAGLDIETILGESLHVTVGAYYGLATSTTESRRRDRLLGKLIQDEKGYDE